MAAHIAPPVNWVHVSALCAGIGVDPRTVTELVIDPWGITVKQRDVSVHYPRELASWRSRAQDLS